jgi:hypothetical protein
MKSVDAYRVGLFPWLVGVPFEGMEMASAAAVTAAEAAGGTLDAAFGARLNEEVAALRARNEDTVAQVLAVEAILRADGLEAPARPSEIAEYRDWFGGVKGAITERLLPGTPEGAALVIGFFLGEIYLTLALGSIARRLHEVAPAVPFLRQHVESLVDSLRKLLPRFGKAMDDDELPPAARALARRLLADLQTPLSTLKALSEQVARLETYMESLGGVL